MSTQETQTSAQTAELDEIIDVQAYRKEGKPVPEKAKGYKIMIDKTSYTVFAECQTAGQLLTLAGKTPVENYKLIEKLHGGGTKTLLPGDTTCFTAPGVERYMVIPNQVREGSN